MECGAWRRTAHRRVSLHWSTSFPTLMFPTFEREMTRDGSTKYMLPSSDPSMGEEWVGPISSGKFVNNYHEIYTKQQRETSAYHEVQLRPPWNPSDHHSTIVLSGLKGILNWNPIMPKDVGLIILLSACPLGLGSYSLGLTLGENNWRMSYAGFKFG